MSFQFSAFSLSSPCLRSDGALCNISRQVWALVEASVLSSRRSTAWICGAGELRCGLTVWVTFLPPLLPRPDAPSQVFVSLARALHCNECPGAGSHAIFVPFGPPARYSAICTRLFFFSLCAAFELNVRRVVCGTDSDYTGTSRSSLHRHRHAKLFAAFASSARRHRNPLYSAARTRKQGRTRSETRERIPSAAIPRLGSPGVSPHFQLGTRTTQSAVVAEPMWKQSYTAAKQRSGRELPFGNVLEQPGSPRPASAKNNIPESASETRGSRTKPTRTRRSSSSSDSPSIHERRRQKEPALVTELGQLQVGESPGHILAPGPQTEQNAETLRALETPPFEFASEQGISRPLLGAYPSVSTGGPALRITGPDEVSGEPSTPQEGESRGRGGGERAPMSQLRTATVRTANHRGAVKPNKNNLALPGTVTESETLSPMEELERVTRRMKQETIKLQCSPVHRRRDKELERRHLLGDAPHSLLVFPSGTIMDDDFIRPFSTSNTHIDPPKGPLGLRLRMDDLVQSDRQPKKRKC